jgi:hypothetical protein
LSETLEIDTPLLALVTHRTSACPVPVDVTVGAHVDVDPHEALEIVGVPNAASRIDGKNSRRRILI